ncbi:IgA-specific serine endopeptidase [Haemophilus influenzae 22.4-21]|uniref:IgA-specific serine endopeptidase n=1 Tax=Haemophilus influenzae 22.4-21 TaxID=375063 RepID=A4NW82_HAEIF|nr:IgA-specific serine endopeptidase [Haemophilus influenzae 22.4-21]
MRHRKIQNGFNRTGTGYSIVANTQETVRITHRYDNGEIFEEKVALKSEFTEAIDKYKINKPDWTATEMVSSGKNAYDITYKKVKKTVTDEEAPKEPLKMDNPLTDDRENAPKVAVVKPEEIPNGVPSHEHSETAPKSDTATQTENPNSESVPSETTEKVAENSKQESETAEKNEQEVADTTPQNDEVAKEAKPTVEANTQTNELAQNGSETEKTQEAETARQSEINSTEETVVEDDPTISEPKSRPRRSISSSSNNINPAGTEDTAKVEKEKTQEVPKVTSQVSPKQEQSETVQPQVEPESENVPTVNNAEAQPQTQPSAIVSTEQPAKETSSNVEQPALENSANTGSATAMTETAEKSDKPQTETVASTEDTRQHTANTVADNSVANNLTSVTPTENSSTEVEQPVTESTTVSTENPVVENPENTTPATTQSAVSSEAVQSETATTEAVISQAKVTSTKETTVANASESSKPKSRRRKRSVSSAPNNVEPTGTAGRDRSAVVLRDLTSTNTNAVISDAMAKAQFVALNVGKAVSQHISQLEMNNEGQYNIWVSNTSMNENYSSSQYRRFSSKSTQTQLGWDQTISNNVQLGGVFTYVRNSNNFDKASSKNTLAQVNFYSKYYADNHWYLGIDLGYGKFQSNLQTNHNAKFARHTAQFGLTAGKAFNLGNFAVKPTVGVRYSYLSNANFALDQDRIKVNPISVKTAFAQIDLSYTYHLGEFSITPILSARYDANQGNGKINVSVYDFAYNVENQQQYNAGLKLKYHNVKLSLIGGLTKAKQAEKQKTAEVKLSFSF